MENSSFTLTHKLIFCSLIFLLLNSCLEIDLPSKTKHKGSVYTSNADFNIVPSNVSVDEEFTLAFYTQGGWGSSCTEAAEVVQTRETNVITLVPYLWNTTPTSGVCTADIPLIRHEFKSSFATAGEYIFRISALTYDADTNDYVEDIIEQVVQVE